MYLKKETKDGETISDYESSGAKIVDKFSAFQSDIVLKVRSPTMNEVGLFREQVSFWSQHRFPEWDRPSTFIYLFLFYFFALTCPFVSGSSLLVPVPGPEQGTDQGFGQARPDGLRDGLHSEDAPGQALWRVVLHGQHRRIQVRNISDEPVACTIKVLQ